ncbi:MAG: hypothetical protein AAGE84_19460 [Cyanobacteria bacterium P01_G01_bin.39]
MASSFFSNLWSYITRINRRDLIIAVITILIWIILFLLLVVFKGSYIFEGQVVASEMSFTYNGESAKPFLQNVMGIRGIDLRGKQSQSLTLKGKFTSEDESINQQLQNVDQIKIDFPYATSRLILTPTNSSSSQQFAILGLSINPQTRINQLTYNQKQQVSFCLQSAVQPSKYCLFPENAASDSNSKSLGNLKLLLAQHTYTLNLEQVNIPQLNIKSDNNSYQAIKLRYTPRTQEPQLNLLSPTTIRIDLPQETKPEQEKESPQWFYEDFDVKDVDFYRFKQSSNVRDKIQNSTIISGKLRMHDQDLNLEKNQFLIVADDKPGIRKLRYLDIKPNKPLSLTTLVSGKSKGIAVGLYPQFPIAAIRPSLLSKYLSSEAIAAILSFFSAFTALAIERVLFQDNSVP